MIELPENFKPKNFWEKSEGTTGMIFLAALIIGGGYGLYHLLPFIIELAKNTFIAIGMLAGLGAIAYIATDKRFQTLLSYAYKSLMRSITSIFITIDPIGILENYLSDLKQNLNDMYHQIANLKGQMAKLRDVIAKNEKEQKEALKLAKVAKQESKNSAMIIKARRAGRLENSNMTLRNLYAKMEALYRVLNKMYETSGYLVEDMEDEIDVRKREYETMKASYSAFRGALKIIQGDKDKKEIFDMTMEYLADDFGRKLGEIEHFMDISSGVIDTIDLQNLVYEENAFAMLDEWEKKTDSLLLGDQKQILLAEGYDESRMLDVDSLPSLEKVPVSNNSKKSKYF